MLIENSVRRFDLVLSSPERRKNLQASHTHTRTCHLVCSDCHLCKHQSSLAVLTVERTISKLDHDSFGNTTSQCQNSWMDGSQRPQTRLRQIYISLRQSFRLKNRYSLLCLLSVFRGWDAPGVFGRDAGDTEIREIMKSSIHTVDINMHWDHSLQPCFIIEKKIRTVLQQ